MSKNWAILAPYFDLVVRFSIFIITNLLYIIAINQGCALRRAAVFSTGRGKAGQDQKCAGRGGAKQYVSGNFIRQKID